MDTRFRKFGLRPRGGVAPSRPSGSSASQGAAMGRRQFFGWAGRKGVGLGLASMSLPALVAACGVDTDDPTLADPTPDLETDEARAIVSDVIDYELTSDEWAGAFGFVTFRLHRGVYAGNDVYYIRTDASDESFAQREGLVWVPKMGGLVPAGATTSAYFVSGGTGDQATVLSSEPGRSDYTPAFRIHNVAWQTSPRTLTSAEDVEEAAEAGDVTVEETSNVINLSLVRWSTGELPADSDDRSEYLGPGQLLEAPDVEGMQVTFKLHECFPRSWYIVTDTSLAPMAEGMSVGYSPRLLEAAGAEGTGRTNVFMNGIDGPGPMGFQPSVFDSAAGDPQWSPYWDHMTYVWKDDVTPRVLRTEAEVHEARDNDELDEFRGVPETDPDIFVVNCPVPVLAPNTFSG